MYAVIQTGGKQYRVQTGEILQVEKLEGAVGGSVKFDQVLLVAKPGDDSTQLWIGKPLLPGASVTGQIVGQGRGEKIRIVKMKRRKQYRRNTGHRQDYTQFLVIGIENGSGEKYAISDADKQAKLAKFNTQLKPRGGRIAAKAAKENTATRMASMEKKSTEKKTTAPKTAAAKTATKASAKPASKKKA